MTSSQFEGFNKVIDEVRFKLIKVMKKYIFGGIAVLAIAIGINVNMNSQKSSHLSALSLANIEALSGGETGSERRLCDFSHSHRVFCKLYIN
jgi:hypothetical protein